ncbi:putative formamidopyrimidine-DNA glycosylase-like protein [Planctomycetes bacterium Pan216]|uniref:Putative formamidopyrimidine-DNA glycosylase-like protein n=1 Tax=Kolteria novifilia TaxID=2527975 RepID=A0A518AXV3_9BACT|nr:putative formamidopyrimidine-DNA glycosylase-like protein [Planctomycetes bacterium Pan216]
MPELPDIAIYLEALERRVLGQALQQIRLRSPFLVRTYDPPIESLEGKTIEELRRLGKRIAFGFGNDLWLVLHLMIAARLHWKSPGAKLTPKRDLAAFDFEGGSLVLTEAGTKKRASIHVVATEEHLAIHDPGGLDVFSADLDRFIEVMTRRNHTLKRAMTDPYLLSGIGNAYSDEILHRARLSPIKWTSRLTREEWSRLLEAARSTLTDWIERLRSEMGDGFPKKVTAFRKEMAVHGRFGLPCPDCGAPIQRIRYADNETNYCARCQCGGKILADRSLSRLLKDDWPRNIDEVE